MSPGTGHAARHHRLFVVAIGLAAVLASPFARGAEADPPSGDPLSVNQAIADPDTLPDANRAPLPLPPRRPVLPGADAASWAKALAKRQAEIRGQGSAKPADARAAAGKQAPPPVSSAVHVARARQYERGGLYDRAIEEYTQAVIGDPSNIDAYLGRGWAYLARSTYQPAIDSFTRAVELNPNLAGPYLGRGWAYERMGHLENAIMEYGEAVRHKPDFLEAYFSRGVAYFYAGRNDEAVADFDLVQGRARREMRDFALLWSYVARLRAGAASGEDLAKIDAAYRRRPVRTAWPGIIVSLFKGDVTPDDVLDAIAKADKSRRVEWRCVGEFFLGQYYLIHGDRRAAVEHFTKTIKTGATGFRQYWAARTELINLEQAAKAKK